MVRGLVRAHRNYLHGEIEFVGDGLFGLWFLHLASHNIRVIGLQLLQSVECG